MSNYLFERFSDDYYRLINQTGVSRLIRKLKAMKTSTPAGTEL